MSKQNIIAKDEGLTLMMTEEKKNTRFKIMFSLDNQAINLKEMIGFNIYELMGSINNDVFETVKILNSNEDKGNVFMVLKKIGSEFGLAQKYIYSNVAIEWNNDKNMVNIFSNMIKLPDNIKVPSNSEPVDSSDSIMTAKFTGTHHAEVTYDFSLVLEDNMPRYIRKMTNKMMFSVFARIKTFIENIYPDNK